METSARKVRQMLTRAESELARAQERHYKEIRDRKEKIENLRQELTNLGGVVESGQTPIELTADDKAELRAWGLQKGLCGVRGPLPERVVVAWIAEQEDYDTQVVVSAMPNVQRSSRTLEIRCTRCATTHYHEVAAGYRGVLGTVEPGCSEGWWVAGNHGPYVLVDNTPMQEWEKGLIPAEG